MPDQCVLGGALTLWVSALSLGLSAFSAGCDPSSLGRVGTCDVVDSGGRNHLKINLFCFLNWLNLALIFRWLYEPFPVTNTDYTPLESSTWPLTYWLLQSLNVSLQQSDDTIRTASLSEKQTALTKNRAIALHQVGNEPTPFAFPSTLFFSSDQSALLINYSSPLENTFTLYIFQAAIWRKIYVTSLVFFFGYSRTNHIKFSDEAGIYPRFF